MNISKDELRRIFDEVAPVEMQGADPSRISDCLGKICNDLGTHEADAKRGR